MVKEKDIKKGRKFRIVDKCRPDFHHFDIGEIVTCLRTKSDINNRVELKNKSGKI